MEGTKRDLFVRVFCDWRGHRARSFSTDSESFTPDPDDGWFFNYVLLPVLVVVLLPALWPLVIYWKVHELFFEKKEISLDKEFSVTRVDLLQRMDINEIEEQEYVVDPLVLSHFYNVG